MVDVRIDGSANLRGMSTEFDRVRKQVDRLNDTLEQTIALSNGAMTNPTGFRRMQSGLTAQSQAWRDAANSSGQYAAQQVRVASATETFNKNVAKQKVSFRDILNNQKLVADSYREQIRLQNAVVRSSTNMNRSGRGLFDVAVPRQVSGELDTMNKRLGYTKALIQSASTQMVNWGKNTQWAGRQLMVGFTVPTAIFGAATAKLAYDVDKQMTRIKKVYDTTTVAIAGDATSTAAANKELADVTKASWATATKAAKDYGTAATDSLSVQAELAATGLTGSRLQDATTETLRIATLGELDYQQATQTTIALQTAFKLNTQELTEAFNFMNATENATSLSIQDIAEATPRAASAMAALGVNVEQMTVLLTAMKESGVDAAEAANALKSATGTILAPSPAAAAFVQQISQGRVEVDKLAKESGGNLYNALEILYKQMEGLSDLQKQQIIVKLFGKYQFNRISALLTNLGGAFEGTQNQTSKAMELMGKSTTDLANTADLELSRFQESASGKFKTALETIKMELTPIGETFLDVGTKALQAGIAIAKAFNGTPAWVKNMVVIGALVGGAAGLLTMLAGLTANFVGTGIKFITSIVLMRHNSELLTKETVAAEMAQQQMTAEFNRQSTAVSDLTAQLKLLMAMEMDAAAATNRVITGTRAAAAAGAAGVVPGRVNVPGQGGFTQSSSGLLIPIAVQQQQANIADDVADAQERIADAADDETESRRRSSAAAGATLAATAATGLMLTSVLGIQNEWVDKAGMLVVGLGLAIPAVQGIQGAISRTIAKMIEMRTAVASTTVATEGAAAATSRWSRIGTGLRGSFATLLNPIGLVTAGLVAAGAAAYLIYKHNRDARIEQEKQNRAVYQTNNLLENSLKIKQRQKATLSTVTTADTAPGAPSTAALADELMNTSSGKALADSIKEAKNDTEGATIATKKYIDVLQSVGGDASKATQYVQALYVAAGDGALEAQVKAQNLADTIGNSVEQGEIDKVYSGMFDNILSGNDTKKSIEEQGTGLGEMLADAMARGTGKDVTQIMDTFQTNIQDKVQNSWTSMYASLSETTKKYLDIGNINSIDKLRSAMADWQNVLDGEMSQQDFAKQWQIAGKDIDYVITALNMVNSQTKGIAGDSITAERAIVKELKSQLGITSDISTMAELRNTWEFKLQEATKGTAKGLYAQRVEQMKQEKLLATLGQDHSDITHEQKLQILNEIRRSMGLKDAVYLVEGFSTGLMDATDKGKKLKGILDRLPSHKSFSFEFEDADYKNMLKTAMSDVQDQMATQMSDALDERAQNSIDALKDANDAMIDAQQDADEKALDKFDQRWELRKKKVSDYYDNRIKNIDKTLKKEEEAEDIRKKIFEAEQARLDRAAQMANSNIDFNVALNSGNFDDAAKIRNDASAQYQQWALEDANAGAEDKANSRSENLNDLKDRLDKAKDARLDALEKEEDQQRDSLQKRQENHINYLKKQAELDEKANAKKWDRDKKMLSQTLQLFKSWQGTSVSDLEDWMKQVGLSYDDFGDSNLKPKGKSWAQYFRTQLQDQIRVAGTNIASDKMWEKMAGSEAQAILSSFGFDSMRSLKHFIKTGEIKKMNPVGKQKNANPTEKQVNDLPGGAFHVGGLIGSDNGGRKGVARTNGLHPSERWILAQKGERVVNRKDSAKHGALIDHINSGGDPSDMMPQKDSRGKTVLGGAGLGSPGLFSAIMGAVMFAGMKNAMATGIQKAQGKYSASSGVLGALGSATAGMYGDVSFDSEQLNNASIIANVGKSMGFDAKGIEIAFMTAMAESGLRNLDFGDRDSLGLFQQRPSQGWGTPEQIRDPAYAAGKFFSSLKGVAGWQNMSPWLAAQAVQRSAFSDGSNYQKWWNEAQAIFGAMGTSGDGMFTVSGGTGGRHRPINFPVTVGVHDTDTPYPGVDIAAPIGSPVFAVGNGTIVKSEDITGYEPRRVIRGRSGESVQDGYRSYGRMMVLALDTGGSVLYGHLSQRAPTGRVVGGAQIGKSGNTGYVISSGSDGAHLHFGASNGSPLSYMKKGGITKSGSEGLAYLHEKEMVATKPMTKDIVKGVRAMSEGAQFTPNVINGLDDLNAIMASPTFASQIGQSYQVGLGTPIPNPTKGTKASATTQEDGGTKGNLRLGTYNVLFSSKNEGTKTDLTKLFTKADVIALTEFIGNKRSLTPWINKQGWGVSGDNGDSAVLWNKAVYKLIGEGSKQLSTVNRTGTPGGKPRIANWAKLQDSKGGSFYQIAAHTVPQDPGSDSTRAEQFGNLKSLVDQLKKSGSPVFLAGDFNADSTQKKYMGGAKDFGFGLNTTRSQKGTIGTHGTVFDWIFSTAGAKLLSQSLMSGTSDHNALLQQFNIPSFKTGGDISVGGLANLHAEERVLNAANTKNLDRGLDNLANGSSSVYNVNVNAYGSDLDEAKVADLVVKRLDAREARKPQNRRGTSG